MNLLKFENQRKKCTSIIIYYTVYTYKYMYIEYAVQKYNIMKVYFVYKLKYSLIYKLMLYQYGGVFYACAIISRERRAYINRPNQCGLYILCGEFRRNELNRPLVYGARCKRFSRRFTLDIL